MAVSIDLTDETAIVTGAGKGIGEAIAIRLAEAGADVAIVSRTESDLQETLDSIDTVSGSGIAIPGDLTADGTIERIIDETTTSFSEPTILVNNAGVFLGSHPVDQDVSEFDDMIDLNLRSVFRLTQAFCRRYRSTGYENGKIINIASNITETVVPSWTAYAATKEGIVGLTKHFAIEMAPDGVTVNAVSPGTTRTPAVERVMEEHGDEIYNFDGLPLDRIAEPSEIADTCLFLASPMSSYITGEEIQVDGGVRLTSKWYK